MCTWSWSSLLCNISSSNHKLFHNCWWYPVCLWKDFVYLNILFKLKMHLHFKMQVTALICPFNWGSLLLFRLCQCQKTLPSLFWLIVCQKTNEFRMHFMPLELRLWNINSTCDHKCIENWLKFDERKLMYWNEQNYVS